MHSLTFRNSELKTLQKSTFLGLSSLTKLIFDGSIFIEITDDAFSELVILETVTIEKNLYPMSLKNITGSTLYPTITTVILRYNDIRTIPREAFVGVPGVRILSLTHSRINWIEEGAFDNVNEDLKEIYLNENFLYTLPSDTLVTLANPISERSSLLIYLADNPWFCNCEMGMQALWSMAKFEPSRFPGDIICAGPESLANMSLKDVAKVEDLVCSEFPSTPIIITTNQPTPAYNTTITTVPTDSSSTVSADNTRPSYNLYQCPSSDDGILTTELTIMFEYGHRFNVTEVDEGVVLVQVYPAGEEFVHFFWFMNTFLEFDPALSHERTMPCRSDLKDSLRIEGLASDSIYTFCMVPSLQQFLSPLHCMSVYLQPSKADRPWLTNRDRMKVYLVIAIAVLFVFVLGVILTYLCIRRIPKYVSGSSGKAQKTSHDPMIMPPLPKRNPTMLRK